jgi:hypothetical protein
MENLGVLKYTARQKEQLVHIKGKKIGLLLHSPDLMVVSSLHRKTRCYRQ